MNVSQNDSRKPSSSSDGDGVRVIETSRNPRGLAAWIAVIVGLLLVTGFGLRLMSAKTPEASQQQSIAGNQTSAATQNATANAESNHALKQQVQAKRMEIEQSNQSDPNDLANYIKPGDPVPTAAELIDALQSAGVRTGIAAFNPPGTSPPLEGLAVPPDYVLPEGYVRHHQVTDEGVSIEPILMYSPDYRFYDQNGRPLPIPENRVVPPERAPPGLPIRRVRIPPSP